MTSIIDAAKLNLAARYLAELSPDFRGWWAEQQGRPRVHEALLREFKDRGYGATASAILERVLDDVRREQRARALPRRGTSSAQLRRSPGLRIRRRR